MLELGQIQSTILREYHRADAPDFERFIFLHFREEEGARALVGRLLPMVTSCTDVDDGVSCVLNIGLTYAAVEMFGFGGQTRSLDDRDHEAAGTVAAFKCGMKARAEAILGDVYESAPAHWEPVYRQERIHAVVWLTAHDEAELRATLDRVEAALAAAPTVERLHDEAARSFPAPYGGTEHFGYVDGIAQPAVLGSKLPAFAGEGTPRKRRGWDRLQPGEFVLGQLDESGQIQFRSRFFANGSFMVFRKLRQHVVRFRDYVAGVAAKSGSTPEAIGAKMIGRWPSGAPLMLSPDRDDPTLAADDTRNNDFRYADDPEGKRCPLGAHIRRNNPREDPTGPGVVQSRLHRIIRRSTPYGSRLPDGAPDDGEDRGVLFVVINADIARQFEFVQQNWVNSVLSSTGLTLPADRDPLVGQQLRGRSAGKFLMPSSDRNRGPTIAWGLPTFVTTRGGAYFLLPSLDALWDIAQGKRNGDPTGCEPPEPIPSDLVPTETDPGRSPCDKLPTSTPKPEPSPAPTDAEPLGGTPKGEGGAITPEPVAPKKAATE
jgi:Dyp-type peroxidase family